ncbi:MAG: redoxin family protein [Planctomycetota bacterium]
MHCKTLIRLCIAAWLLMSSCVLIAKDSEATVIKSLKTKQSDGLPFEAFPDGSKFCVAIFVTTTCPIANSFQPELETLRGEYESQGVSFVQVIPSARVSAEQAQRHRKQYKITMPTLLDPQQSIAKSLNAKVTPEAFLIDGHGRTLYQGRISNLYAGFGKKRQSATQNDLADAIDAALAGEEIVTKRTKAVGCIIRYSK